MDGVHWQVLGSHYPLLSFFIFFAKKLPFFHHSVHSLWKGEHAILKDSLIALRSWNFSFLLFKKKMYKWVKDFFIGLMWKVENLPTQVIIWKTFAKLFYQIESGEKTWKYLL
jgi:hypothetical protein